MQLKNFNSRLIANCIQVLLFWWRVLKIGGNEMMGGKESEMRAKMGFINQIPAIVRNCMQHTKWKFLPLVKMFAPSLVHRYFLVFITAALSSAPPGWKYKISIGSTLNQIEWSIQVVWCCFFGSLCEMSTSNCWTLVGDIRRVKCSFSH